MLFSGQPPDESTQTAPAAEVRIETTGNLLTCLSDCCCPSDLGDVGQFRLFYLARYARNDRSQGGSVDPTYSAEAEQYREKVQAFLAEHLPAGWKGLGGLPAEQREDFTEEWRALLAANRLIAPAWPVEYGGGGLSAIEQIGRAHV